MCMIKIFKNDFRKIKIKKSEKLENVFVLTNDVFKSHSLLVIIYIYIICELNIDSSEKDDIIYLRGIGFKHLCVQYMYALSKC